MYEGTPPNKQVEEFASNKLKKDVHPLGVWLFKGEKGPRGLLVREHDELLLADDGAPKFQILSV